MNLPGENLTYLSSAKGKKILNESQKTQKLDYTYSEEFISQVTGDV